MLDWSIAKASRRLRIESLTWSFSRKVVVFLHIFYRTLTHNACRFLCTQKHSLVHNLRTFKGIPGSQTIFSISKHISLKTIKIVVKMTKTYCQLLYEFAFFSGFQDVRPKSNEELLRQTRKCSTFSIN